MKKRSSLQKKRAAARRKKRLKQRKRLSVQQRLARLAKEQALANLIATLSQFPTNLTGAIESEHEEHPHLLKLGRSLWNVTLNSEAYPQRFERLQPRVQQQLSVTARVSLPQRLTSSLSVGAATVRREAALLWEAPGQRIWPLAPVGCRMTLPASMPQVVTHARGSILSPVTPGSPYVVAQPTFSCSITLKQPPAKLFCQEGLLIPPQSSGYPAASRRGSCRTAPAAAVNPDQRADNPPGAEQSSSESIKGRVGRKVIFKEHLRETARLYQSSKYLRKTADFIRKSSRPDKKPSLGIVLNRAKKQRQLGQTGGSILRLRGWSRAADTGLWMKHVKLLGRKQRGVFHSRSIRRGDGKCWLRESRAVSSTDSHHPLFTLIPSAAVPWRRSPSVQFSPAAAVDPALRADSPPAAEQASPNKNERRSRRIFVVEEHLREARTRQATKRLRKTTGFIRKSSHPDKKLSLRRVLSRARKQRHLGQPGGSILRLRGWSPADDTGLGMKQVKLLGRKHLGSFHWPSISRSDGQLWLRESRAVSSTDRHRQLVTLIPPVAVPRREPPSVQLSPTVVVNPELRADNPLEAEQSSSDDEKGITWDKVFGAKKHPQEARTRRATEDSSDDELGAEPDSFDDEKEITGQGRFEVEGESAEAIKARQADSCSICWVLNLLNGEQPMPERVSCEDLVEHLQFVQEIAALLPLDLGCDDHKGLRYEIPHSCWLASLPNRCPFWDPSWI